MEILDSEFGSRISRYSNVLYLCHRNADPDAIGSGFARNAIDNRMQFWYPPALLLGESLNIILFD